MRSAAALELLLSSVYSGALAPNHLADLRRSGLTDATLQLQRIRSVPSHMIDQLLGFDARGVVSAYLIPFPDPHGGWLEHVRLKVFPTLTTERGTLKYLQPRGSGVRLYFPLATLDAALTSDAPLWLVEGEKKALATAQLGFASVGFPGIDAWHASGTRVLLSDFDVIPLKGRVVELVPDGDVQTNPHVRRGAEGFALALANRGARPRLVTLPAELAA
jgi:putative DNA primase/helicase